MNKRGTATCEGRDVSIIQRRWKPAGKVPFREVCKLTPGQHWLDAPEAPTASNYSQHYVLLQDPMPMASITSWTPVIIYPEDRQLGLQYIPAEIAIARELITEGALCAVFTDCWARRIFMDTDLWCVQEDSLPIHDFVKALRQTLPKRPLLGGLPDVLACFPDGRIAMREAKHVAAKYRDRLGVNQREIARVARTLWSNKVDFAVVEWGAIATKDPVGCPSDNSS
jgi:hypothetical protein